jgi:hypothetical protein
MLMAVAFGCDAVNIGTNPSSSRQLDPSPGARNPSPLTLNYSAPENGFFGRRRGRHGGVWVWAREVLLSQSPRFLCDFVNLGSNADFSRRVTDSGRVACGLATTRTSSRNDRMTESAACLYAERLGSIAYELRDGLGVSRASSARSHPVKDRTLAASPRP